MSESLQTVFVRPIGMVGSGKSSMLNGIAGYMEPGGKKFKQVFPSGNATAGIEVDMNKKVSVNPDVLGEGESMTLGDAQGIGSSADDSTVVFDRLLDSLKKDKEPATLLIVSQFTRTERALIKLLKLLSRCTSLSSDNCVLVLTRATDADNGIPASEADPSKWISEVQTLTKLDCFVKDKNVFCIDYNDAEYRKVTTDRVRAALITKMRVTAYTTYAELLSAANECDESSEKARDIAQAKLDVMESDLAWHERRIEDLAIAVASTAWIPYIGIIPAAGMAIAIVESGVKAQWLREEISKMKKTVSDASAAKKAAKDDVDIIHEYLS